MGKLVTWIGSFVGGSFASVVSTISDSFFKWYAKSKDTKVELFKTGTGVDVAAYTAFLNYDAQLVLARLQSATWWGAHLCFMIVAVPVCLHTALMFADSFLRFGCGHYGCLGIPDVPPDFRIIRTEVMAFLFGAGAIKSFASIAAPLLRKT